MRFFGSDRLSFFLAALSVFLLAALIGLSATPFVRALRADAPQAFPASAEAEKYTVILDAGHGGEDSGTIGANGCLEKDINLSLVGLIGEEFIAQGWNVIYTRTEDRLLYTDAENIKGIRKISDLKNRCKIASEHPDAFFLSIHMNAFGSPSAKGLQVYYSPNGAEDRKIAEAIQNTVRERLQPENHRQVKEGKGIYVLEHIENPAVLVECGFL